MSTATEAFDARQLARDGLRVFSAQSISTIAGILAGIALVRTVGPAGKGALAYANSTVLLACTAFSGITTAAVLAIARHGAPRGAVVRTTLRAATGLGLLLMPLLLVVALLVPSQRPLAATALAAVPALLLFAATALLQYQRRITAALVAQQIGSTGFAILGTAVALAGAGLIAVFAIWIVTQIVAALVALRQLRTSNGLEESGAASAVLSRVAVVPLAVQIVGYLNLTIDVYIVAAVRTPTELGIYALALAAGQMLWQVSRSIVWPAFGPIADLPMNESALLSARLCARTLMLVGPIAVVAWFLGPTLITLVYGAAFAPSGDLVRIVLPGIVAMAAEAPLGSFLMMRAGRAGTLLGIQLTAVVFCVTVCLLGLPRYGLTAAAVGTSVSYVFAFIAVAVVTLFERLSLPYSFERGRTPP